MKVVCPCCATGFPIEAGLVEGDAKRLGKLLGDMEPAVARAAMGYLRLFKPVKHELRVVRAVALLTELAELINAGRVSRDERTGLYRPCSAQHWMQGIEQMLQLGMRLELPLKNHNYLRAIVFGLADKADAQAEVQREKDRRQQRGGSPMTHITRTPLQVKLELLADWRSRGLAGMHDDEAYKAAVLKARDECGAADVGVVRPATTER